MSGSRHDRKPARTNRHESDEPHSNDRLKSSVYGTIISERHEMEYLAEGC